MNTSFPSETATLPSLDTTPTISDDVTDSTSAPWTIDAEMQAINAFRIFVCTIGVLGNLIVVLMILVLTEFKKGITHWYILQLAIADTAFLLTLPFQVVEDQNNEWIFPDWMCKAKEAVLFINYYCSITFLTIMAGDRYIAICHSFSERLQKLRTHFAAYVITAVVWIVSILICVPVMMFSVKRGFKGSCKCELAFPEPKKDLTQVCIDEGMGPDTEDYEFCLEVFAEEIVDDEYCADPPAVSAPADQTLAPYQEKPLEPGCHHFGYYEGYIGFLYFNFVVMFIIPFVIIAVCYALIINHLRQTKFKGDSKDGRPKSASKDDRNRDRVVIMCVTLVVVFTICWLPYHSVNMAKMSGIPGSSEFCRKLLYATSLLVYLNSAINPFVYFIVARFKSQISVMKSSRAASAVVSFFTRQTTNADSAAATSSNSQAEKGRNASKIEEDNLVRETTTKI